MNYFEANYDKLKFIHGTAKQTGLRSAQIGAMYAVAAHFTTSTDPAVVVMPTGSGKSAVIMASCYLLRPKRVLILTPSKLLRRSIVVRSERKSNSINIYFPWRRDHSRPASVS